VTPNKFPRSKLRGITAKVKIGGEIDPLGKFVKALASVCRTLNDAPQLFAIHVFQKETGTDDPTEFPKGIIQLVFPAGGAERRC